MARKIEKLKIQRVITKPEDIRHFRDTEGNKYGLKPVPPDLNPHPEEPPFIIVEPWRREPTPEVLMRELPKETILKPLDPLPILRECVKQRNALIAFYIEANGKQWRRQDNWCNKYVNLEDWYGVTTKTRFICCCRGRRPIKIQTVTRLELPDNNIHCGYLEDNGRISSRIGDLKDLEVLNLARNFIQGGIPDRLWELTKLRELYLHFNQLEGKISSKIGNLTQLSRVQLDHNHLTGRIPESIGNLKNLQGLFLHVNNLDSFWRTYMLLQLNKGKETIEKRTLRLPLRYKTPIPASIGKLTRLREFCVYSNQLYGVISTAVKSNPNYENWKLNPQQDGVKLT